MTIDETPSPSKSQAFLGWRMVRIGFLANFLASGITLATFGNFVDPVSETFGVARSTASQGMAIAFLVTGLVGPLVGALLDRGRARAMMATGSVLAGIGLILLSRATEFWQAAILFCGLVGLGSALFGIMPSMALVSHWFVRQRGLAIGLSAAGLTIAAGFAPAIADLLIDLHGWRTAVLVFGLATIGIGLPVFGGFVIGRPEAIGQRPDGDEVPAEVDSAMEQEDGEAILETRELIRDPKLWILSLGFGLILTSPLVLTPIIVPYGTDLGLSSRQASGFFLAMMPFSLLGKLVIGKLADVAPIKPAMALVVLGNFFVWVVFYLEPNFYVFLATGALYGIGIGGAAPIQGVAVGRLFGRSNFGRASGLGGLVAVVVITAAMVLFQFVYGVTGGYGLGFIIQGVLVLLGGALIAVLPIPNADKNPA
ncbi:MAG: MFS transporter [Myxococcota bacterium]